MSILLLIQTACLNANMDDVETYSESLITNVRFEYRWTTNENQLVIKELTVSKNINKENHTIECSITVPEAGNSFTEAIRKEVSLSNLVCYLTVSTGASVVAMGNAPTLGTISNFSDKNFEYKIISADEKSAIWKFNIIEFIK